MIEKNIYHSKTFKVILIAGGALIIILASFEMGVAVGFHKASFSYRVGEHYDALFGDNHLMPPLFDTDSLPGGHEAAGKVMSISLPTFVVVGPDNIEKKIDIASDTAIAKIRGAGNSSDIKVGDSVVIIGAPGTDSDIDAQFIRIFPTGTTTNGKN